MIKLELIAEITLIKANTLPTSSGLTHRLVIALVPTVHTGVKAAKTKPKIKAVCPGKKAGIAHPTAPEMQAMIKMVAS